MKTKLAARLPFIPIWPIWPAFAILLCGTPIVLGGCSLMAVPGSGNIVPEVRDVLNFHSIDVGGSARVTIEQFESHSLIIETDDNLLPHIQSEVRDGVLHIGFERGSWAPSQKPVYRIQMPEVRDLVLSGSVSLQSGALVGDEILIRQSGASKIEVPAVSANRLELRISGSGRIELGTVRLQEFAYRVSGSGKLEVQEGQTQTLDVRMSGSGSMDTLGVRAQEVSFQASGAGRAKVWAEESLSVQVSGSGKVEYKGSPTMETRISGSGKVTPVQP